jgi:phage gpG-like protein
VRLELNVVGDQQVNRELLRFAHRAVDARPLWDRIILDLRALEEEQFSSKGARASGGWQELADSTKERKAASSDSTVRANAEVILKATEALYHSVTDAHGDNAIRVSEHDEMRFGTRLPYAEFHQLGHGVPQRRFLELTETDRHETFVRQAHRFLVTGEP